MSLAAGALPRIPLGELTALPQTHGWILGRERKGQKEGEREREGKERTKRGVGTEGGKGKGEKEKERGEFRAVVIFPQEKPRVS